MSDEIAAAGPFQWPFIGIAVLLVLLLLATPSLLSTPAGSPATEAVLVVDWVPTGNHTHAFRFTVEGVTLTRYDRLSLALATRLPWPVPRDGAGLNWSLWNNLSNSVTVALSSTADPVAVNVSAEIVDASGASALYLGVYAFNASGSTVALQSLLANLDPGTPTLAVTQLPESLPLLERTTGGM
ncbi:MAG TPA: hypothetical protein VGV89_01890 [Thermoplasmata archaeon]|nr:hypothetical protein [Thermoplasmata archaeon]